MGELPVAGTRKTQAELETILRKHFPGKQAMLLAQVIFATNADVTAIETWGAALATKLNADAGVTDTNYDTTPI